MSKKPLHVNIIGEGKPIVLIHGFLSSSQYFKAMQKRLADSHQVISLDLLGFGQSPKPHHALTYDEQVEAIHQALTDLKIHKPFTLLGHSMGALVVLRYAITYSKDVSNLQLFNPPMFTSHEQAIHAYKTTGKHYRMLLHSPLRHGYWRALKFIPHNATSRRPEINFADTVRMSRYAREGGYKNIITTATFFSDLEKVDCPTLLVVGKYDRLVYQENIKSQTLPSNVSLEIVESGHHTLVKTPDLGEKLIREHL